MIYNIVIESANVSFIKGFIIVPTVNSVIEALKMH